MTGTITVGLAGLILTAGAYVSGRRKPSYREAARKRRLDWLCGATGLSFLTAIGLEVFV